MIRRTFLALPLLAALPKVQAKPACTYKKLVYLVIDNDTHAVVGLHDDTHTATHHHDRIGLGQIHITRDFNPEPLLHVRLRYDYGHQIWLPGQCKRPDASYGPLPHVFVGAPQQVREHVRLITPDCDDNLWGIQPLRHFAKYTLYL